MGTYFWGELQLKVRSLVLVIYNFLLPVALLVALPAAVRKARQRGNARENFLQRLSVYSDEARALFVVPTDIWVHAVSVGEVLIAKRLIGALLELEPERKIVLSTTTPTGHAVACEQLPSEVSVIYSPLDLPGVVHRALALVRPKQVVLVEAEIWPNFLTAAHAAGIPVSLVNARLSPRSARRFTKFRRLVAPIYRLLSFVGVQEGSDKEIWMGLGVAEDRIGVTGSLKFDPSGAACALDLGGVRERLQSVWPAGVTVVLAASTHSGEERLIAEAVGVARERHSELRLMICPRHVERSGELVKELGGRFSVERRTGKSGECDPDIFLIDTTGELNGWTQLADVVIIGKSFLAKGGQNPAEAIAAGKPTVIGPHMENFAALVAQLRKAKGILIAESSADLPAMIEVALRSKAGEQGKAVLESHRGACVRTAKQLLLRGSVDRPAEMR